MKELLVTERVYVQALGEIIKVCCVACLQKDTRTVDFTTRVNVLSQQKNLLNIILLLWRAMIIITIHLSDIVINLLRVVGMFFSNKFFLPPMYVIITALIE